MAAQLPPKEWHKDSFLVSTDQSLLSLPLISEQFAAGDLYWAKFLPEEAMSLMLASSMCFGLYKTSGTREQIGFARAVTDNVTMVYLTDVFVLKEHQSKGLGTWLIQCVREWMGGLPHLRRTMLITGEDRAEKYYEKHLGMKRIDPSGKTVVMNSMGPGAVFF